MPSVHRDSKGRSPYWYGSFLDEKGKWRLRSTKERDHAAAMVVAERWQREADILRGSEKMQNKEAVLEALVTATQQAARNDFSEATAMQLVNDLLAATGQAPMARVSVSEFLLGWVEGKRTSKAEGTSIKYAQVVQAFLSQLGSKRDANLSAVVPRDIEKFRDGELKQGKSPSTANAAVKILRAPFNLARRQGLILTNPAEAVELLPNESAERKVFTAEQLSALLDAADTEWKGMILLGATCGLRIGDASRITWENVDLEKKVIRYLPQKTAKGTRRKPVETVILPDLEDYLLAWLGAPDSAAAPLFPTLFGKKVSGAHGLSKCFQLVMKKAGVFAGVDQRKLSGKGRRFSDLSFHSLRHTFISIMANAGVAKEIRMKLAGHSSNVHERYTHLEVETYRNALAGFPRLSANP